MPRPHGRTTSNNATAGEPDEGAPESVPVGQLTPAAASTLGSLSDLPVAGLTRRRVAILIGALVAAWVIVLFARQVSDASEAMARSAAMSESTEQLRTEVVALESELALIQRQTYIEQAARQYRLGSPAEIPFALADDAPPLAVDAPGSATVRLGAEPDTTTPLESWARLLFGDPSEGRRN
jgi:cell division protein FtsB